MSTRYPVTFIADVAKVPTTDVCRALLGQRMHRESATRLESKFKR
jgi:hypothetical protein